MSRAPRARHAPRKATGGFSLIEVLVGLSLLTVGILGVLASIASFQHMATENEFRIGSLEAAHEVLDRLRASEVSALPSSAGVTEEFYVVPSRHRGDASWIADCNSKPAGERNMCSYRVTVTYCTDSNYCPPAARDDIRHISVTVNYRDKDWLSLSTIYTDLREG